MGTADGPLHVRRAAQDGLRLEGQAGHGRHLLRLEGRAAPVCLRHRQPGAVRRLAGAVRLVPDGLVCDGQRLPVQAPGVALHHPVHDGLPQAPGGVHHQRAPLGAERVDGEGHPGGVGRHQGLHHHGHAGRREGLPGPFEAAPVGLHRHPPQRGGAARGGAPHLAGPGDPQVGVVQPGEAGPGEVLGHGGRAHRHRGIGHPQAPAQLGVRRLDLGSGAVSQGRLRGRPGPGARQRGKGAAGAAKAAGRITKPGGTGRPARTRRTREAPLPPSRAGAGGCGSSTPCGASSQEIRGAVGIGVEGEVGSRGRGRGLRRSGIHPPDCTRRPCPPPAGPMGGGRRGRTLCGDGPPGRAGSAAVRRRGSGQHAPAPVPARPARPPRRRGDAAPGGPAAPGHRHPVRDRPPGSGGPRPDLGRGVAPALLHRGHRRGDARLPLLRGGRRAGHRASLPCGGGAPQPPPSGGHRRRGPLPGGTHRPDDQGLPPLALPAGPAPVGPGALAARPTPPGSPSCGPSCRCCGRSWRRWPGAG